MTTGLIFTADLAATTLTDLGALPASAQSFTVHFCNRNSVPVKIRCAPLAASGTPAVNEYFVYDILVGANEPLILSGIISGSAKHIVVQSDTANVGVNVYGT